MFGPAGQELGWTLNNPRAVVKGAPKDIGKFPTHPWHKRVFNPQYETPILGDTGLEREKEIGGSCQQQPDPIPIANQSMSLLRREAQGGVLLGNGVDVKQRKGVDFLCIYCWMARVV